MMKSTANASQCEYSHVPVSLFPTPYPVKHYQEAKDVQESVATMVG